MDKSIKLGRNELIEVSKKGLIPEILQYSDLTKNITREEFAEVVVEMYQQLTSQVLSAGDNAFIDTINENVVIAYNLGITKGISDT